MREDGTAHGENLLAHVPEPPRKVVVLRASRLGDFLCTAPALRALRHALPHAEIVMVTLPMLQDLVVRSPYLDGFVAFPGHPGIADQFFEARRSLDFFRRMQAERFDLAIQLQGSGVYANPFTLMLGARHTAGFIRPEDAPSRLDAALPWPEHGHEIHRMLALMQFLGVEPRGEETTFPLFPSDRATADLLLEGLPRPLIGLHPGAHNPQRRWPLERFMALARELQSRHGGTLVLVGGRDLAEEARFLELQVPSSRNLVGATSLGVLGAVVSRLSLLVTSDSGPAHVAFALNAPAVVIYRAGGVERYGPLGSGPFAPVEPLPGMLDGDTPAVSVEQVLEAADRMLAPTSLDYRIPCPETTSEQQFVR